MAAPASRLEYIAVSKIRENSESDALRTEVDKNDIAYIELVNSVREEGILLPLLVREEVDPTTGDVFYPIVDGLHRFTAASEVGLETVPAHITTLAASKVLAAQVMANATRVETPPAQFAIALKKIFQLEPGLTATELGTRVGKSKSWVEIQLKLTKLTKEIQALVDDGKLAVGNAANLAALPSDKQADFLQAAMTDTVAVFGPKVTEALKEIRAAARGARVVETSFKATAQPRKTASLKSLLDEVESGDSTTLKGLLQANGINDAYDAAAFLVKFVFSLDPQSVAIQKAKWEQEQKEKAEKKAAAEADRAAKKEAAAKEALAKVTNTAK